MRIKLVFFSAALMAVASFAQEMPLADARAKIGECIAKPALMTETMKKLSPADQKAFIGEVNAAIAKMPGSNESRAAACLNANRAALKGSAKGNMSTLVAEVFATVPPEMLTIINERFAADLFNRSADPAVTYTDERYEVLATNLLGKVVERTSQSSDGAVRSTFAILMLVRASNTTSPDLINKLVDMLPADSRAEARDEWIPAALAEGSSDGTAPVTADGVAPVSGGEREKSYEPLLAAADTAQGVQPPSPEMALVIAGPQLLDSLLSDLVEGTPLVNVSPSAVTTVPSTDSQNNQGGTIEIPVTPPDEPEPEPEPEPGGYQGQTL